MLKAIRENNAVKTSQMFFRQDAAKAGSVQISDDPFIQLTLGQAYHRSVLVYSHNVGFLPLFNGGP